MLRVRGFVALVFLLLNSPSFGQEAPAPYQIKQYDALSTAITYYSAKWESGSSPFMANVTKEAIIPGPTNKHPFVKQEVVSDPDGSWIIVRFADFNLGKASLLKITSQKDPTQQQLFDHKKLALWEGQSAMFNGGKVEIELSVFPGDEKVFYRVKEFLVGEFLQGKKAEEGTSLQQEAVPDIEAICGADDRTESNDNRLGRIMPVGCTGWAVSNGAFLTAGHCAQGNRMYLIEFEVPKSLSDGTPVHPNTDEQYKIIRNSIEFENDGIGRDWAVFSVVPNDNGQTPDDIYGAYRIAKSIEDADVSVRGYGLDDDPPGLPPALLNSDSQTQQQHVGEIAALEALNNQNAVVKHRVDTRAGNSGSPIFFPNGSGRAIGIHTHGGCNRSELSANHGTSFEHGGLWEALTRKGALD